MRLAVSKLNALSPLAVLNRGYAFVQDAQGEIVRDAAQVKIDEELRLQLGQGVLKCRVIEKEAKVGEDKTNSLK
jgi:exodeoxyribonuclease VII large subunit